MVWDTSQSAGVSSTSNHIGNRSLVQTYMKLSPLFELYLKIHDDPKAITIIKLNDQKLDIREVDERTKGSNCSVCPGAVLSDLSSFRNHFQTDWHIFNLSSRHKNHPSVNQEDFLKYFKKLNNTTTQDDIDKDDIEGDDTDSSEYSSSEDEQSNPPGSPFLKFSINTLKDDVVKYYEVYKAIFFDKAIQNVELENFTNLDFLSSLEIQAKGTWIVVLIRSGRIAAAVFDNQNGNMIKSKTFKRYTTRRKQGGSQSSKDSSKGSRIRSAGALIRRKNEQHLAEDLNGLFKVWREDFENCNAIFWNATINGKQLLMENSDKIYPSKKWRSIQFTTYKPTLEEAIRCYKVLNNVYTFHS